MAQTGRCRHLDVYGANFRALNTPFDDKLIQVLPGLKIGVSEAKSIPGIVSGYMDAETGLQ